ncbi:taste receptor type 2 member 8-like [Tiliqua scincoides]|uniref:taste receptor type 2 member 8-like n=1 Tax=Tiliqua scincoides TaxID=71010 RepID=UPI0034617C8C
MANFAGTTCLTVFYCVKVTTFAHPLFLWLKSRIDRLVPLMLVISLIGVVAFYLLPAVGFWRIKTFCGLTRNLTANTSHTEDSEVFLYVIKNSPQFLFTAINFSICLTAAILLIVSLWRHTKNLKKSGVGTKDLSTQAHIKVIKQLVFFLVFYILYFVTTIISTTEILMFGNVERLISDTIFSLYPSAHSIILIRTNPKLKGVCTRILSSRERSS